MYMTFECLICKTIFIIPMEDVDRMKNKGKYIACNFGHRNIREIGKYDNIRECMQQRSYSRIEGRLKQKW